MFSRSAVVVLAGIWALFALNVLGVISGTTYLVVLTGLVGYGLGWIHAAHEHTRERKAEAVQVLSQAALQMSAALSSDELDDDQRQLLQLQRTQVMELLGRMDQPSLRDRLLEKIGR